MVKGLNGAGQGGIDPAGNTCAACRPSRSSCRRISRPATLTVHFADAPGPFNMPLTVRATLTDGDPVVAETKLEVDPE